MSHKPVALALLRSGQRKGKSGPRMMKPFKEQKTLRIGYFRVTLNLIMKVRLSAKILL